MAVLRKKARDRKTLFEEIDDERVLEDEDELEDDDDDEDLVGIEAEDFDPDEYEEEHG